METNQVQEPTLPRRTIKSQSESYDNSLNLSQNQIPTIEKKYFHCNIVRHDKMVFRNVLNNCDDEKFVDVEKEKQQQVKKILLFELKIKRLSAIDTTAETFRCGFHYYLTWLASKAEFDSYNSDSANYVPQWIPKLEFANAIEIHEYIQGSKYSIKSNKSIGFGDEWEIDDYFGFKADLGRWNRVRFDADITFAEELELEAFPFDCQDLSLYIKVEKDTIGLCDIVPFPRRGNFCLLDPQFSVLSEWQLENLVSEFSFTDPLKSKSLRCYSLVSIHIKACRRWEAHIGMIIVIFCMFSLGLGTFAQSVEPDFLGERLGFCVTFLLADVATLQLMFVQLPTIPYWTILDFYIYTSFIFLFIVTIWSCFAGANHHVLADWDYVAFYIFLSIYLIIHLFYILLSIYHRRREKAKLTMTNSQLFKYFQRQTSINDKRAISNTWDVNVLRNNKNKDRINKLHFQGIKFNKTNSWY